LIIKDLLDIDESRISRSKHLKVRLVVAVPFWEKEKLSTQPKSKPKLVYYVNFKYKVKSDSGKEYTVFIKVSPNFNINKFLKNKVQIFCQCPDFMYRAAYNLSKDDNVFLNEKTTKHLEDALTTPSKKIDTTNLCKHLYAAIIYFKNNMRSYPSLKSKW